jgi:hypothetical protein
MGATTLRPVGFEAPLRQPAEALGIPNRELARLCRSKIEYPAMDTRRDLLPLAGFLVYLVGFFSYFFLFLRFPVTRDVPWANWLLFAVGLALLGAELSKRLAPLPPSSSRADRPSNSR